MQRLPGSSGCFVCDIDGSNHRSLRLPLQWDEIGREVRIECQPDASWCGYEGVVHGGLVATVLDEAMAWAVRQETGDWAFTADFHLRYRQPVRPDTRYFATARVTECKSRKITAVAEFSGVDGSVTARAQAVFLPARGRARQQAAPGREEALSDSGGSR